LILVIEGIGRTLSGGQALLQAFRIISYEDESGTYHLRAFNDRHQVLVDFWVNVLGRDMQELLEGGSMAYGTDIPEALQLF
jgi:hypothetical protein